MACCTSMTRSAARASVVTEVPGYAAGLVPIIPPGASDRDRPDAAADERPLPGNQTPPPRMPRTGINVSHCRQKKGTTMYKCTCSAFGCPGTARMWGP